MPTPPDDIRPGNAITAAFLNQSKNAPPVNIRAGQGIRISRVGKDVVIENIGLPQILRSNAPVMFPAFITGCAADANTFEEIVPDPEVTTPRTGIVQVPNVTHVALNQELFIIETNDRVTGDIVYWGSFPNGRFSEPGGDLSQPSPACGPVGDNWDRVGDQCSEHQGFVFEFVTHMCRDEGAKVLRVWTREGSFDSNGNWRYLGTNAEKGSVAMEAVTVVTDYRVDTENNKLQKKTRTIYVPFMDDESDWTDVHTGDECA